MLKKGETQKCGKMRILVVDDSTIMRRTIRIELEKKGFEILEAEDGLAAVEMVEREQPDLIAMDVDMPRRNGFDAVLKIRNEIEPTVDQKKVRIPIVFITANGMMEQCK